MNKQRNRVQDILLIFLVTLVVSIISYISYKIFGNDIFIFLLEGTHIV